MHRLSEASVAQDVPLTAAQTNAETDLIQAAHTHNLKGPEVLLAFLDHLNLQGDTVSSYTNLPLC